MVSGRWGVGFDPRCAPTDKVGRGEELGFRLFKQRGANADEDGGPIDEQQIPDAKEGLARERVDVQAHEPGGRDDRERHACCVEVGCQLGHRRCEVLLEELAWRVSASAGERRAGEGSSKERMRRYGRCGGGVYGREWWVCRRRQPGEGRHRAAA